jgi:hypothetical protein
VGLLVIGAIRELPQKDRPDLVYGCEGWGGLDWLKDKVILDVSRNRTLAHKILSSFESQIAWFGEKFFTGHEGRYIANATHLDTVSMGDCEQACFAMDLTPLTKNDSLNVKEFVLSHIEKFKNSIAGNLPD